MKILLVSEGAHELSGALETLVRRALEKEEISCAWRQIKDSSLRLHPGKGSRFLKRAVHWMIEARKEGFDALVLVVDEDGYHERVTDLDRAQEEQALSSGIPRACGIAIRSFDAWMLADEKALSAVLNYIVPCQKSPEKNRDPKGACEGLLADSTLDLPPREFYAQVAAHINFKCLIERCPKGFGVFIARVRAL